MLMNACTPSHTPMPRDQRCEGPLEARRLATDGVGAHEQPHEQCDHDRDADEAEPSAITASRKRCALRVIQVFPHWRRPTPYHSPRPKAISECDS